MKRCSGMTHRNVLYGVSKFRGFWSHQETRGGPELQNCIPTWCSVCNGLGWVFFLPRPVTARIGPVGSTGPIRQDTPENLKLCGHPAVAEYLKKEKRGHDQKLNRSTILQLQVMEDVDLDQDDYEDVSGWGRQNPITAQYL